MITFSSLGGTAVSCLIGKKPVSVYGKEAKAGELALLSGPQEEPTEGTISWPGEYDVEGIAIRGIGHDEGRQVSFVVTAEGTRIAFLSSPLNELSDHELELMGNIDVLVVPTDDAKIVQKLIDDIDPRVLIPLPGEDAKAFGDVLKAVGAQGKEPESEYKLKSSLPTEGREVVLLQAKK